MNLSTSPALNEQEEMHLCFCPCGRDITDLIKGRSFACHKVKTAQVVVIITKRIVVVAATLGIVEMSAGRDPLHSALFVSVRRTAQHTQHAV